MASFAIRSTSRRTVNLIPPSTARRSFSSFQCSTKVSDALRNGKPIVALESTIISHGMPWPENLECAKAVEKVIVDNGAVPATIAILNGTLKVGLETEELRLLAQLGPDKVTKCSRRDLARVVAEGGHGATTVAGTMVAASLAGIRVFATGGIGGVHRGAFGGEHPSLDVSADLTELGRTPVCVVCAGVKSILDVGRTLEYLETQGVPVMTFQTDRFPDFFTVDSGLGAPSVADNHAHVASVMKASLQLGLENGMMLAVPNPSPMSKEMMTSAVKQALAECEERGIAGKDVTPFLLSKVNEITGGSSLESNVALVKNNAKVAAQVAVALHADGDSATTQDNQPTDLGSNRIVVVGGACIDTQAKSTAPLTHELCIAETELDSRVESDSSNKLKHTTSHNNNNPQDSITSVRDDITEGSFASSRHGIFLGSSTTGVVTQSSGGVGRNIAACIAAICRETEQPLPLLLTCVGSDTRGDSLIEDCKRLGIDTRLIEQVPGPTASYVAILDATGDLVAAVADMEVIKQITPLKVSAATDHFKGARLVVADANLEQDTLNQLCHVCTTNSIPLLFEPVSVAKVTKAVPVLADLTYIKPNLVELRRLHSELTGSDTFHESNSVDNVVEMATGVVHAMIAARTADHPLYNKSAHVFVTRGKLSVVYAFGTQRADGRIEVCSHEIETEAVPIEEIVNTTGAGDSFVATLCWGIANQVDILHVLNTATHVAAQTLRSNESTPSDSINKLKHLLI